MPSLDIELLHPAIRRLHNEARSRRLVIDAINRMKLDLSGLTVLTEVATGPFVLTPIIAALAGAHVLAVTRSSRYGAADDVLDFARDVAGRFEVSKNIELSMQPARSFATRADIVTNLGFVRPIDRSLVVQLKPSAVICLMWSPWEFRKSDIDSLTCKQSGIPIVGTNEEHPNIRTLDYLGLLSAKLLFERDIEILGAQILVVASNPFGKFIRKTLEQLGAEIRHVDPTQCGAGLKQTLERACASADAIVLAEHRDKRTLIGGGGISEQQLNSQGTEIIHICGAVDLQAHARLNEKHPSHNVPFGVMTLTTDYLGPKPVIDLHAGGLKVGEIVARARQEGFSADEAARRAEIAGYGAVFP